jgi:hypothetical protein
VKLFHVHSFESGVGAAANQKYAAAPPGNPGERGEPGRAATLRSTGLSSRPRYEKRVLFILGRCGIYQDASGGILCQMTFAARSLCGIGLSGHKNGA